MTTDANLLRRYHANLSAAEDEPKWKIDREFRTRHKLNPGSNSIETIWSAHLCRVRACGGGDFRMGTKKNPGQFDCLAKLAPDEPFFVLRAQDVFAPMLVAQWADHAEIAGCPPAKVEEARRLAASMRAWPNAKAPD